MKLLENLIKGLVLLCDIFGLVNTF